MNAFLSYVSSVIFSLIFLDPFLWFLGALIVCACAVLSIRFVLWR